MQTVCPVHFWEEPVFEERTRAALDTTVGDDAVMVLTPRLPHGLSERAVADAQRSLLEEYLAARHISRYVSWYYTPMALSFTDHLLPDVTVYDCMDELSAFQGAPPELLEYERQLLAKADVVFCGGASLYEAKRTRHRNAHLFPSSIARDHFAAARHPKEDPADQAAIPHPRIGFFGVLDERLDCTLLRQLAEQQPDWHFVLIGPVVKIKDEDLPKAPNLHYLGGKDYRDLPAYIANWDVAMLPFARNASTRFIRPTKTPEYLAAGKPVVSTPIQDVIRPYGDKRLVHIAEDAQQFAGAIRIALEPAPERWLAQVDEHLSTTSWDKTFAGMLQAIRNTLQQEVRTDGTAAVQGDTRTHV